MKGLFVDISGWMAAADAADPSHAECRAQRDRWLRRGGVLVTTDVIVATDTHFEHAGFEVVP